MPESIHVTVTMGGTTIFNADPDTPNLYGSGETIGEHERLGHQATEDALRSPAVVKALLRGQLSIVSPVTNEVIRFEGIHLGPSRFEGLAGEPATVKARGEALSKALDEDISRYVGDVLIYIDKIENHGFPLLATYPSEIVYTALSDGTIVTKPPPEPPTSLR